MASSHRRSGLPKRQWLRLGVVAFFPKWWLSVRVAHNGPSTVVNGKMGSPHLGEGPRSGDRAREVMIRHGSGASLSLGWRWGKFRRGSMGQLFIGERVRAWL
jgi:hypothetical protein